jgi:hypothetical protein
VTESGFPINVNVPAPARRYDAWLGGKDNFAADRASAAAIGNAFPPITLAVAENRRCLLRVVRHLADERGIRQFLDIGSGVPRRHNVHDVAQEVALDSRIVYVDNDPMVAVHARALCVGTREGAVTCHLGDLREPKQILTADLVRDTLDFTRPIGVLLFAVLHFLPDTTEAQTAVDQLVDALPRGSYLAISHATFDPIPDDVRAKLTAFTKADSTDGPFHPRSRDEIAAFLHGLDLVDPGIVSTVHWHPDLEPPADPGVTEADAISYVAVAVKP